MFAYLDCHSGVSGDKLLGALVDAGFPFETLVERLGALGMSGFRISAERTTRGSLAGTLVTVEVTEEQPARHLADIERILRDSSLDEPVRARAFEAFRLLAEAESAAHGVEVAEVHFHEVGAVDSIVDVVGTAIGLAELGVDELWASPVCTGSGEVETSHGTLPVPAPATSRLLEGVPAYAGRIEDELTTPTGAALLRTFVTTFAPMPEAVVTAEGYGAGAKEFDGLPNLLRLRLGERVSQPESDKVRDTRTAEAAVQQIEAEASAACPPADDLEQIVVLESAIDHVTPEDLATATEHLLEAGALDCWQTPIVMKKGRLGSAVTVLARAEDADRLCALLMTDTGTLGVRRTPTWRTVAERRTTTLETSLGAVRVKIAEAAGVEIARPEHDDVAGVSRRTGLAIKDVAARLSAEVAKAAKSRQVTSAIEDTDPAEKAGTLDKSAPSDATDATEPTAPADTGDPSADLDGQATE